MQAGYSVFDISGRAMAAQMVRLNTTASNLANAGSVSGSEASAYRSMKPVFRTLVDQQGRATVGIDQVVHSRMAPSKRHDPTSPMADAEGNVWVAAVDTAAELVEMVETAQHYRSNVQALETAKGLINETLRMGQ
ncbi:MAG: flagellar basal body rod protein FlgC [Sphingopyxis sp.]|nr:flagellar basal body rod protein FlgC [Sphingopyxis sp.]